MAFTKKKFQNKKTAYGSSAKGWYSYAAKSKADTKWKSVPYKFKKKTDEKFSSRYSK
jgi:hypothetical protein